MARIRSGNGVPRRVTRFTVTVDRLTVHEADGSQEQALLFDDGEQAGLAVQLLEAARMDSVRRLRRRLEAILKATEE